MCVRPPKSLTCQRDKGGADKGGATVIISKTDYHAGMLKILEDERTYCTTNDMPLNRLRAFVL